MQLEDIYQFFQNPPPTYPSEEQAACYVLSVFLQGESYGTDLIERLEREYPDYRLSDTVFYSGLKFLADERALVSHWQKTERRGHPRRMYQVEPEWLRSAEGLAAL